MTKRLHFFLNLFLAFLAAGLFSVPLALSAFDPVNDDTDIFLANPNIPANRPNVLIVLDNTANWNTPFSNEKAALVQVVNSLNESFNVGLMMMVETGGGNDNVDGAYVRYHVRQMLGPNKIALSTMVNNLDILGDKANNNSAGFAMHEAYLYFAGKASRASHGKLKTDFVGNTANNPLAAPLTDHALPASPTASSLYRSPITDLCQKNFIIYISNGPANENASARAELQGYLETLTGASPPATIAINPNGQQGNWADEMTKYMANADVNTTLSGVQNVYTYAVEINPSSTGQGPAMTALLNSMANQGKGKYFGVTSDAGGAAIVSALNQIFSEVQSVNSVFAATTLPVSVNVRGTNLNQVYIGVFRPNANKAPYWLGNLKMYNLALNNSNEVFLADAAGNPAQNSSTGFITGSASSFWTDTSNFWGFRTADENGAGGVSDKPDGDLVEKGGVAQMLRTAYANAEASTPARSLYTCTSGSFANCVANSSLSATPFSTANTDISALSLALDTRAVSPLTAYAPQTVTNLTDRKAVTLDNGSGSTRSIASLVNGGTTVAVSAVNTNVSRPIATLSAMQAGTQTASAGTITKSGSTCTATMGSLGSQFVPNARVTLSGFTGSNQNGSTVTIASVPATNKFTFACSGSAAGGAAGTASVLTFPSTTATATFSAAHGFSSGQTVIIAGAAPAQFNTGAGGAGITVVDATTIRYSISSVAVTASATGTASSLSTTATATTATAHGLPSGTSTVIITGATPAGYNCPGGCVVTNTGASTFTYTVGSALTPATVQPVVVRGGSTTVTATTSIAHGYTAGTTVNILGANPSGYNGSVTVNSVPTATTFTYTTASILPAASGSITASTANSATVTATAANHGFNVGDSVVIASVGGTDTIHPGTFTVLTTGTPTANSFTYSTGTALASPTGTYTVRPASSKAYVTLTGHGYSTGDPILISGASPAGYNGVNAITVVDANTFTYPLSGPLGVNTGNAVTASKASTTARARAIAHGFANNSTVQIVGATPAEFNGTFTITVIDDNSFTYTLGSAQGDATGTISAIQTGAAGRDALIRWVRGEDNFSDENVNGLNTDVRAYGHGDVLHSRPAVINYNRYGSDNDVYVYYGSNDGVFRAVKGGFATDASAAVQIPPGREAWGFIAPEFFDDLNRLRKNSPIISSSFKKPYFVDGGIGVYTKDTNNNGMLGDTGDKVNVYMSMRRGGRFIYALDVNNPHDPKFLWKIDNSMTGFEELGQTWSQPTVVTDLTGYPDPVLVFGAGYDPVIEDLDPSTITASTATTVTTGTGASAVTYTRSMGRGIYVVNALTGALLWRSLGTGTASATTNIVSGMDYAIPSNITIVRNESGGNPNRGYVGDTGGNMWRVDFRYDTINGWSNTIVTQLAAVGGSGPVKRKFLSAPDVVGFTSKGFDAVLAGSGDREHPFDTTVTNRFYMFKDTGNDAGPITGTTGATGTSPYLVETALFDATSNCIQDAAACVSGTSADALTTLNGASGWYVTLATGEKVTSTAVSVGGTTFFNTNQPSASAGGGSCGSNLGIARQYRVSTADATSTFDLNASGTLSVADRSSWLAGGGYVPDPVRAVVKINDQVVQAVMSGPHIANPGGLKLNSRLRRYWYKELD